MQRFTPEIDRVYLFSPRDDGRETGLLVKHFRDYSFTKGGLFAAGAVVRFGVYTEKACIAFITREDDEKKAEKFLKSVAKKLKANDLKRLGRTPTQTDYYFGDK